MSVACPACVPSSVTSHDTEFYDQLKNLAEGIDQHGWSFVTSTQDHADADYVLTRVYRYLFILNAIVGGGVSQLVNVHCGVGGQAI